MVENSQQIEQRSAAASAMVRVRIWREPDAADIEYYEVSLQEIDQLRAFVETGSVASELREDLEVSLRNLPAWSHLTIDGSLTLEQRQSTAAVFVMASGKRSAPLTALDLQLVAY